ncbi:unnamed protein product [Mytilus edulis]|uniref:Uncharacterized protein n=1 Tax=Mytilus edulis TaxID=6550 RepID=A0A8S3Q3M2_MYTED|nr:unnamed protein product [Mytilus edulis]
MKSKHHKADNIDSDKEENTSKSKDLLIRSSESAKRQDPGDILVQDSDESANSEKEENRTTLRLPGVRSSLAGRLGPDIIAVGSKSVDVKGLTVDNPDKQTDKGGGKVTDKKSIALCATCKKRKISYTVVDNNPRYQELLLTVYSFHYTRSDKTDRKEGEYTAEPTEEMTSQDQTILDDDRNRPCIPQDDPACTPGAEGLRVDLQHILQVCQHLKQLRKSGRKDNSRSTTTDLPVRVGKRKLVSSD